MLDTVGIAHKGPFYCWQVENVRRGKGTVCGREGSGSRRETRWCLSNTAGGETGVADGGGVETAGPCSS